LDRMRLSPAADVLLRRELFVLERLEVPAPTFERLFHKRVESRNDHAGVTNEWQSHDRLLEHFPDPQQVAARGSLHMRDEPLRTLVVRVTVGIGHRPAGGDEAPP